MDRRDTLLLVGVVTLWGLNVVIDWGMADVPPLLFLAMRFTLVVLPAVFLVPRPDAPWRLVVLVGTFMSLGQFGLLYLAVGAGLSPGIAALVLQAQVLLTVLLAAGTLRQAPTRRQLVGVVVGSVGLVVVALSLLVDGPAALGAALATLSWQAGVSTLYTAGLASLVGYSVFNALLAHNPASSVVPWVLLAPPIAIASAWALLGDAPNAAEVLGGAVMLSGVLVASRRRARPPARTEVAVTPG